MQRVAIRTRRPLEVLPVAELLLRKMASFVGWEVAGALAYMRLGALASSRRDERLHFASTIRQLEAMAECVSMLMEHPRARTRVDDVVRRLCRAMACWRLTPDQRLVLELAPITVSGELARVIALTAADLVSNSIRCALECGGQVLRVQLQRHAREICLTVIDDGPGTGVIRPMGSGLDRNLTSELIGRFGGRLDSHADEQGAVSIVTFPNSFRRKQP